jgi:hypothetical protein
MTPHQQWFTDYKPHCIPICVANNAVVYSKGIGAVVIEPSDQSLLPCKMIDVLYVPDLQNSLLSVLHLVSRHHFCIEIEGLSMSFSQQGSLCFTASICSNTAYLNVSTPLVAETLLAACMPLTCFTVSICSNTVMTYEVATFDHSLIGVYY